MGAFHQKKKSMKIVISIRGIDTFAFRNICSPYRTYFEICTQSMNAVHARFFSVAAESKAPVCIVKSMSYKLSLIDTGALF